MTTQHQLALAEESQVCYNEVNCSQHCQGVEGAPRGKEQKTTDEEDGLVLEDAVEPLASLAAREVVLSGEPAHLSRLASDLPADITAHLHHAAKRKKLQDKMSRISHKCAVVCLPLCVGQVKQLEATYPNSNQHASGFRLRFHWQHREFYTLFDGLSLSGDEAWSRGLNLWPLTLCLKSLPGLFGDEDLVQDWISTQQNKGLPKENCCAWPTWIPLGCDSETTFLFVNSSPSSPYYGHLRYIITNTQEDRFLACSLSKFFALLECYISQTERMVDPPDLIQWLQSNNSSSSS